MEREDSKGGRTRGATGPRSRKGKTRSSQNAIRHGCTSKQLLLPNEDAAEWEALRGAWMADYEPDSDTFQGLVERAAEADWMLRRATNRYNEAEQFLYDEKQSPLFWSAEQHRLLELFARYRTTAERSFHRARQAAEQVRKTRFAEELRLEVVDARREREAERTRAPIAEQKSVDESEPAVPKEQRGREEAVCAIVQDCEVYLDAEGKTVTDRWPPDEDVRLSAASRKPPVYVRRPIYFRSEIPAEYEWLRGYTKREGPGTRFSLLMSFAEWEERARQEEENGGHLVE